MGARHRKLVAAVLVAVACGGCDRGRAEPVLLDTEIAFTEGGETLSLGRLQLSHPSLVDYMVWNWEDDRDNSTGTERWPDAEDAELWGYIDRYRLEVVNSDPPTGSDTFGREIPSIGVAAFPTGEHLVDEETRRQLFLSAFITRYDYSNPDQRLEPDIIYDGELRDEGTDTTCWVRLVNGSHDSDWPRYTYSDASVVLFYRPDQFAAGITIDASWADEVEGSVRELTGHFVEQVCGERPPL